MATTTKTRLGLEPLEARENPAVGVIHSGGSLIVTSDGASDTVRVEFAGTGRVQVGRYNPSTYLWENVGPAASGVTVIAFYGNGGDDTFYNNTALRLQAYGGDGNDTLVGGPTVDWLSGGAGDDLLVGAGGNDTLTGGDGRDTLHGNAGDDELYGDTGFDKLYGGDGNDKLYGGTEMDYLFGGAGNDYLSGGQDGSSDSLYGESGADTFVKEPYNLFGLADREFRADFSSGQGDRGVG